MLFLIDGFTKVSLPDEFIDGLIELLDGVDVVVLDCVDDTGRHVFLEDHTADRFDGRFDRGKLDQHLGAVAAVFHHTLSGFHVTDYAAHPVEHCLCVLR